MPCTILPIFLQPDSKHKLLPIRSSYKDGDCSSSYLWRFGTRTWQWQRFYIVSDWMRHWENWRKKEVTSHGEIWTSSFSKTTESLQASFLYRTTLNEIIDPHRSQQFQKPGFFFLALPKNELTKCKQRKIARGNIRNKDRPTEKLSNCSHFVKKKLCFECEPCTHR